MKLHAQNKLYTSISFSDKVLKTLWACIGMPDHTNQNLHDQFITLTDMKLHAQNQIYTFFSFRDLKILIASFDMLGACLTPLM